MADVGTHMMACGSGGVTPRSSRPESLVSRKTGAECVTPIVMAPGSHVTHTSAKSAKSVNSSRVCKPARSGSQRRCARSAASSVESLGIRPFGFESKTGFDATQDLLKSRSESKLLRPLPIDDDIWNRPPPDFRPQVFAPKPPKRNSREAIQPWKYGTIPGQRTKYKRPERVVLPHILNPTDDEDGRMVTQFHIADAFEDKMEVIKGAMHHKEPFLSPKPHDFRPYPPIRSLGLPEFTTDAEKDPFKIKFESDRLNIIHGLSFHPATDRNIKGLQMAPPVPLQPHFEGRLVLKYEQYPIRPASYTRFRRINRDPRSALMDRIEERMSTIWAKEKLDQEIEKAISAQETINVD